MYPFCQILAAGCRQMVRVKFQRHIFAEKQTDETAKIELSVWVWVWVWICDAGW